MHSLNQITTWKLIYAAVSSLNSDDWLELAEHFGKKYHQAVGSLGELNAFAAHTERKWIGGYRQQPSIFH
ncbi:MAG: hypothetical protein GY928_20335 [Colwellia sp.]|nr:hypothetical protein [Colwellia sp.]